MPPVAQLLKNFRTFYRTRRFITVFTGALHWSLSWARSIQSILPHPISLRSILVLSSYLRLGLPSGLFPSGFPTNILYAFLFSPHACCTPFLSHFSSFDHSNYIWRRIQVMKFSSLNIINLNIMLTECVSCEVRTEYLNIIKKKFVYQLVEPIYQNCVTMHKKPWDVLLQRNEEMWHKVPK
jgi:hypothetical protein